MSIWDLVSDNEQPKPPDCRAMCEPQGYFTMIEADGKESGYAARANAAMDSAIDEDAHGSENLEMDWTVIEKRQPKLTKKGKTEIWTKCYDQS